MAKKIRKEQVELPAHIEGQYHYNFNHLEAINQPLSIGANVNFNTISGVNGGVNFKQAETSNATGLWWKNLAQTQIIAGMGTLTYGDNLQYSYIGWGATPWSMSDAFVVYPDRGLYYKNFVVYHSGNLDLSTLDGQFATVNLQNIDGNLTHAQRNVVKKRIGVMTDGVVNPLNSTTQTQTVTLANTTYPRLERIWYGAATNGALEITKTAPVDGDEIVVHGKQCVIVMKNHRVYSPHASTAHKHVSIKQQSMVNSIQCVHMRFVTNLNAWVVLSATSTKVID